MTSEEITCRVEEGYEHLGSLQPEWDQAVLDLGGPIHMSYDWTRVWWQFYGEGRRLRLFIFRTGGRIVGLVPIYIDTVGLPPWRFRLARLVGAYIPPKVFDPPVEESLAEQIWLQVVNHLFSLDRCDLLSFGPISEHYRPAVALRAACRKRVDLVADCETLPRDVRTIYHLPATYEDYFNSLDTKERKVRRKKLRDLETAWSVRTEVVQDIAGVEKEFEAFVEQHTRQWQGEGRPGHFLAWPQALEYNRALVRAQARSGRVRFLKLMAGEHVAANQYTFAFGKTLFAELPSRIAGPQWERFSLGCTSQIKLIETAIQEGFQRMDSGLGHYDYKILTNGEESRVEVIHVVARKALSRARTLFYSATASLMRLVLQKAWYRRIMPRLPAILRGGQSRALLRLDF